jgi:predicted DNA-binding antitoxin AbrB/MazE fold protein
VLHAIYEHGMLRLLEPVNLREGQQVEVVLRVSSEDDVLRTALADLNVIWADPNVYNDSLDEAALQREIEEGTRGIPSVSDLIIEERHEGR